MFSYTLKGITQNSFSTPLLSLLLFSQSDFFKRTFYFAGLPLLSSPAFHRDVPFLFPYCFVLLNLDSTSSSFPQWEALFCKGAFVCSLQEVIRPRLFEHHQTESLPNSLVFTYELDPPKMPTQSQRLLYDWLVVPSSEDVVAIWGVSSPQGHISCPVSFPASSYLVTDPTWIMELLVVCPHLLVFGSLWENLVGM